MTISARTESLREVRRRTVLKGAAWSVPAVVAAVAVSQAAASVDCACFRASTLGQGVNFSTSEIAGGTGNVLYNAGVGIDARSCQHVSQTYQVTISDPTLTMSDGSSYAGQIVTGGTTNNSFAFDHGAVPANMLFAGVSFPDGDYSSFGGSVPVKPQGLSVIARFEWDGTVCTKVLNYAISTGAAGFSSGQVTGGTAVIGVYYQMNVVGVG